VATIGPLSLKRICDS
jgi:hypothetical protein